MERLFGGSVAVFSILKKPMLNYHLVDIRMIANTRIIIHNMTLDSQRNPCTFNDAMLDVDSDDTDRDSDENDIQSIFRWELVNGKDAEEGRAVLMR